ncbi:hypothetical protein C2845_PM03G27170 [Panicum miliaceum]|uniref:DUF7769 domain-containing protein n=1 Tax=Panicum miliaceum TaxID=4540 RepID=A0A3L6T5Y7_PANMI|nr:hypothetical protein C2845_PM03G27170 [Panicum miliaceum]
MRLRRWLTDAQRYAVYTSLHAKSRNGKLPKKATKEVATFFHAHIRVIQRIWRCACEQIALGQEVDVSNRRTGRVGCKKVQLDHSQMASIPLNRRSTLKSLAKSLDVSVSTLHRKFKLGEIRCHSSTLKPLLRESNKRDRLKFCILMLDQATLGDAEPKFIDIQNIVHIDEKWYFMTKKGRKYYLPEEDDPVRAVQNKNSIGKVMFVTAVARPKYDGQGDLIFSGKLRVWAFVKEVPAARRSQNRERGTLETKSIIVNKDVMRQYLIEKVIPAIEDKWPQEDRDKTIFIQQDNARTHVLPNDPAFLEAVARTGLDIRLMQQSANSPDMNVLDLGFFNSIQSLTDCGNPETIEELIYNVEKEFEEYNETLLNRVFLSLQSCMKEVMRIGGENGYKLPHMNKQRLEREGKLPNRLSCENGLYAIALAHLAQFDRVS